MEPSRIHYLFAEEWPALIWLGSGCVIGMVRAAVLCQPTPGLLGDGWGVLAFLAALILGFLVGYLGAVLLGMVVLGFLYCDRGVRNGEPFRKGDVVRILVGPHRDRIVRVLDAFNIADYAGAHRIRVELGEDVGQEDEDLFRSYQVLLVERGKPEPVPEVG